jgi:hypothetical protein
LLWSAGPVLALSTPHEEEATGRGAGWTKLDPVSFPGPRAGHAMDYDPVSRRVFLFGGFEPLGYDNESWWFDASQSNWSRVKAAHSPAPRAGHAMVYEPRIARFVLFGGFTSEAGEVGDTWQFDPSLGSWENLTPSSSPPARAYHTMAYHGGSGRIVLFGGTASTQQLGDTWTYDAFSNSWKMASPPASPEPRYYHAMVDDPRSGRVMLFGGWVSFFNDETWSYDPARDNWTRLLASPSPSARQLHAMVYSAAARRVVMFGGWSGTFFNGETWQHDGALGTWRNATLPGGPSARTGHAMAYDRWNDLAVLFGGVDELGRKFDTWVYRADTPSPPPKVVGTDPADGETGVEPWRSVEIEFDREMAPEETAAAISISPPLAGTRVVVTGRTALLVHVADLAWNATYEVTVTTGARSVERARLVSLHRFTFSAQAGPSPPGDGAREESGGTPGAWLWAIAAILAALLALLAARLRRRKAAARVERPGNP